MIAFFEGIGHLIEVLGDFIVSFFESLGSFIEYMSVGLGFAKSFLDYLPAELVAIGGIVLSAGLIYTIVGR